jgi:HAD superfamily hydrolase (TIGR01509 family)
MSEKLIDAVIFDLDGVITNSTPLHSSAWKEMFDGFLRSWSEQHDLPFREFTHEEDYLAYVDGKPRYQGVESFLESRGIELPYGKPTDKPGYDSACALGNLKNELYNRQLSEQGVEVYASTVDFIHQLKHAGIPLGLATSSKNATRVLEIAGLKDLFQSQVDGLVSAELGLQGKPFPDIFQAACDRLGAAYERSVIIEDANSGVEAGHRGHFGLVIGVARENNREELELYGADLVVEDLQELSLDELENWFRIDAQKKSWLIEYHSYIPPQEGTREALCATGNGYFCTRGAMEEIAANQDENYPGTYIAGVYNRLESHIGGKTVLNEDLVNAPNWLPITFRIGSGDWFDPRKVEILEFNRCLDLHAGMLHRSMMVKDSDGNQTRIHSSRMVSMADPNLAALVYTITPLNYATTITVRSELDGTVSNLGVERYRELSSRHLKPSQQGGKGPLSYLGVETNQSGIKIGLAARLQVYQGDAMISPHFEIRAVAGKVTTAFVVEGRSDRPLRVEKTLSLHSSNLPGGEEPLDKARRQLSRADNAAILIKNSSDAWNSLWENADVKISGDRLSQRMIRLHIYHSLTSYSPHSRMVDAGIPARGLTGEGYRGHIFWDELYVLPFYSLHFPETARSALLYRFRRLPAARQSAANNGMRGAEFPWQSGSSGEEETQQTHLNPISGRWGPDNSHLQRHVSLAIAYNVWNYYLITADIDFLSRQGAELILCICLYWASLAVFDPGSGRYSISHVMGPDEFHETYPGAKSPGLSDNAYTNLMVVWIFQRAFALLAALPQTEKDGLLDALSITGDDLDCWQRIAGHLSLSLSDEGILEQFQGYFDLQELDWEHYQNTYQDIHRLDRILKSEGLSPNNYKVAKQADTLMLFYNLSEKAISSIISQLGYQPPENLLVKNLHYYLQRTSHGSTLSRLVHAYLAHLADMSDLSWKLFQESLCSDYQDIQGGTTREGIHLGVMTGTVVFIYRAYAGLDWSGDVLALEPSLPSGWNEISFNILFKGNKYEFAITPERIKVKTNAQDRIPIEVRTRKYQIPPGKWLEVAL